MKQRVKNLIPHPLICCLNVFVIIVFAGCFYGNYASEVVFRQVVPKPNRCIFVYGGFDQKSKDFLLKECDSKFEVLKPFSIGYIKKMLFINENTAFAIVGGSLVRFNYDNTGFVLDIVERESDHFYLEDVFFIKQYRGWASGENGLLIKTNDGGKTWSKVKSGTKFELNQINFVNDKFGWSLGSERKAGVLRSILLLSEDGGRIWKGVKLPRNEALYSIFFSTNIHGCGLFEKGLLCTWNGKNWIPIRLPDEYFSQILFLNPQNGWIVGDSILHTVDGGASWIYSLRGKIDEKQNYESLDLDSIYFMNEKVGWTWGLDKVLKTTDGGKTWRNISNKWIARLKKKLTS